MVKTKAKYIQICNSYVVSYALGYVSPDKMKCALIKTKEIPGEEKN